MSKLIPASNLADVARRLSKITPPIQYRRAGKTIEGGMDSATFLWYCLKELGIDISSSNTNSQYKQIGANAMPLREALRLRKVVPGAILFHVKPEDENGDFKNVGPIDADYVLICIDENKAVYVSEKAEILKETGTNLATGRANMIVFHPALDYGPATTPQYPQQPQNPHREVIKRMVVVNTRNLILREHPDVSSNVITGMPLRTVVNVFSVEGEWVYLTVRKRKYSYTGWAMISYLMDA